MAPGISLSAGLYAPTRRPAFIIDLACRKAKLGIEFDGTVPGEVVKLMIENGLSPLGAWRRHRGLSQVWVGRIEAGGGYGSQVTRRKLAAALDAPVWALEA